jgi:hypothetical protein
LDQENFLAATNQAQKTALSGVGVIYNSTTHGVPLITSPQDAIVGLGGTALKHAFSDSAAIKFVVDLAGKVLGYVDVAGLIHDYSGNVIGRVSGDQIQMAGGKYAATPGQLRIVQPQLPGPKK